MSNTSCVNIKFNRINITICASDQHVPLESDNKRSILEPDNKQLVLESDNKRSMLESDNKRLISGSSFMNLNSNTTFSNSILPNLLVPSLSTQLLELEQSPIPAQPLESYEHDCEALCNNCATLSGSERIRCYFEVINLLHCTNCSIPIPP